MKQHGTRLQHILGCLVAVLGQQDAALLLVHRVVEVLLQRLRQLRCLF